LTFLAHSYLSNKYWVDSFITTVFVINRRPTPTFPYLSPYGKLYKRALDYQRLRVFGCLCYPQLLPYGLHKLDYRSKPFIFLGYNYAGYKLLESVTNDAYLSHHVVFNENSFPAKNHATSLFPSKLSSTDESSFPLPLISSIFPPSVELRDHISDDIPLPSTTTPSEVISSLHASSTDHHPLDRFIGISLPY